MAFRKEERERDREREREREREKHLSKRNIASLPPVCALAGD